MTLDRHERLERDAAALWRRVCPGIPITSIRVLGEGEDHRAVAINERLVLRHQRDDHETTRWVHRERAILELAARRSTLPVPAVVAADEAAGVLVTEMIHGITLLGNDPAHPEQIGEQLAEFIAQLHATPPSTFVGTLDADPYPHSDALAEANTTAERVRRHLSDHRCRLLDRFLEAEPPDDVDIERFAHNDLGAEHLLVDPASGRLVGVIDWSDAAATDPARDLARLLRDLPGVTYATVRRAQPGDDSLDQRVTFLARCALLEDLAFGIEQHRTEYATNAIRRFDELFQP